jgi:RHS repeat-associated protein
MYRGYYYDSDLNMYYLQSRYYDPNTCRFINADGYISTGQGLTGYNMFAYCGNNPVTGYDPTGHLNWGILASGIGQVLVGGGAIVAATTVLACSSVPAAMLAIASITFIAGALTVTNGVSEIAESVTGHNYVRDDIMGGNTEAYETYKEVTQTVSSIGASICTAYYMYNGGNICFVAGTLVKAENGDIAIEDIRIGDKVYAYNDETGEIALKSVVNTFVNEATELVHVFINNEEIICTNEHPFYSPVKGWTEACQLRAGDILVSLNGEYVIVEKVQHEILESPIKVYNFEVEDFHTYYVGNGDGVLVHNSCNHNYEWRKERESYWKSQAITNETDFDYGAYVADEDNIKRMSSGLAPIGWDGNSVHLHHWDGIANDFYNYSPVSRTFHNYIHRNP